MDNDQSPKFGKHNLYLILILAATSLLILAALVMPFASSLSEAPLKEGEVASVDIRAPVALAYTSEILTNQQKDRASLEIEPVYSSPDTNLARRQLERVRAALAFITSVRADTFGTTEQKLNDLAALEDIQLKRETAVQILEMSNLRWEAVQREALAVLEQVMRSPIREDRLEEARLSVPAAVSLYLPDDQVTIVAEIVSPFVIPNSLYIKDQTDTAKEQAREAVAPQVRSFAAGETVVPRGKVISSLDIEALTEFGLLEAQYRWQDLLSAATLSLAVMILMVFYIRKKHWLEKDLRSLVVITLLFLGFLFGARLIIPGHTVIPYMFPLAAYALLVAVLYDSEFALISTLPMAILVTLGLTYSLELTIYYSFTSFVGVLVLGRARRITSFFWAGFSIALAGMAVIIVYRLPQSTTDITGLLTLIASATVSGVAAAGLALLLQFFLAQVLGKTTALQLVELSRPDHPLMQLLLRNAPGTYQHSLQVANLAEQAAEKIGADALLTRVGALYHDIGKIEESIFFIENQVPGSPNPHDTMDPSTSAAFIIRHITQGVEMARKYRLPHRLRDFIREHHGSSITRYQYSRAVEAAGGDETKVDITKFRYPGPRPQSRETALLMLADTTEASVRAVRPKDENALRSIIKNVVDTNVAMGTLNDTDLTLQDLEVVVDSFTATLRGIYHPRLQYPKLEPSLAITNDGFKEKAQLKEPDQEKPPAMETHPPSS
jgi:cyclic-di-AMP phosphodiesterase PgpH